MAIALKACNLQFLTIPGYDKLYFFSSAHQRNASHNESYLQGIPVMYSFLEFQVTCAPSRGSMSNSYVSVARALLLGGEVHC